MAMRAQHPFACIGWILVVTLHLSTAHITLNYPPPRLPLDFLDNARTSGLCGEEKSEGFSDSHLWRWTPAASDAVTELKAGSEVTVSWNLHYPHQGGWGIELYNNASEPELVAKWENYGCSADGVQRSYTIRMPNMTCESCFLRFVRQAGEWGESYRFHSCAAIKISTQQDECQGCSGHGTCAQGSACNCTSSPEAGFWEGKYCENENECELDEHCGEGGLCVDVQATTPPRKQCYCKEGYFGVVKLTAGGIPARVCNQTSSLKIGDPEEWDNEYTNKRVSTPEGNMTMYWKIEGELIEFAIKAQSENWVAVGFRPSAAANQESQDDSTQDQECGSEAEPPVSGEVVEPSVALEPEGSSNEPEPEPGSEPEEGFGCPYLSAGEALEVGATPEYQSTYTQFMPEVEEEGEDEAKVATQPIFGPNAIDYTKCALAEAEAEAEPTNEPLTGNTSHNCSVPKLEPESEPEPEIESENIPRVSGLGAFYGTGACRHQFVPGTAHPMINQDIVIGYARNGSYKIVDSFTPSRARPLPDKHFGGRDDVVDAIGTEKDGFTYLKFQRKLETGDASGDYCITRDVQYTMIYAYGQTSPHVRHDAPSSIEINTISDADFYKADELKFHGGGISCTGQPADFDGRGSLGLVDFHKVDEESGCEKSTLEGFECMFEVGSGYIIHYSLLTDAGVPSRRLQQSASKIKLAGEAKSTGYVALAFSPKQATMTGATAVIGSVTPEGQPSVDTYYLGGKITSAVSSTSQDVAFAIEDAGVEETSDGKRIITFTRAFDESFQLSDNHNILVAWNPDSDSPAYHGLQNRLAITRNFQSSESQEVKLASLDEIKRLHTAHGTLMFISWGILLPLGVILARGLRDRDPLWFHLHRGIQVLGVCLAFIAWVIAMAKFETPSIAHKPLGYAVMSLGLFQPLNALLRPHKGEKYRCLWEWVHLGLGRSAIILSIATIFLGLERVKELYTTGMAFIVLYAVNIGLLTALYGFAEYRRAKRCRASGGGAAFTPVMTELVPASEKKSKIEEPPDNADDTIGV